MNFTEEIQHQFFQRKSKTAIDFLSENDQGSSLLVGFSLSKESIKASALCQSFHGYTTRLVLKKLYLATQLRCKIWLRS